MALDATILLRSAQGQREVALDAFYHDYMVNDLKPGEFLEAIRIPAMHANDELRVYKISKRFDQDISAVCGAFRVRRSNGIAEEVRIAFGGMAATVKRARNAEAALSGVAWSLAAIEAAMRELGGDFEPISDMRATADYRMRVAKNLLKRLYLELAGETGQTVYEYGRQA